MTEHPDSLPALEQRMRRLEDAVAGIQDDHGAEERIVARLSDRLVRSQAIQVRPPVGLLIEAPRPMLPAPENGTASSSARPEPLAHSGARSWLLLETVIELRAIWWMFRDPRYRISRQTWVLSLVLLLGILASGFWVPGLSFLGWFGTTVDKVIDIFLAFVLYKVLIREAYRYRQTAPDVPHGLRL